MFLPPCFDFRLFFPQTASNPCPVLNSPTPASPMPKQAPAPAATATVAPAPAPARPVAKAAIPDASSYANVSISPADLETLGGMYGDDIEQIYDLYPGQERLFEGGTLTDRAQFLQLLIRVEMDLRPADFRRNLDEVCARVDNLRTAYAYRYTSRPYRVVLKHRRADISYETLPSLNANTSEADTTALLERVMAWDRMRGFNLEKDPLLRLVVYQTGEENVYAILVSQPHINTDGMSIGMLIQNLFLNYALNTKGIETLKIESDSLMYSNYLKNIDKQAELDYWKAELGDYGPLPELPGHMQNISDYDDGRYALRINDDTYQALMRMQSKARVTLFNLLQTAWGVSLLKVMRRSDIVVGVVISGRDMNVADSAVLSGGFSSVLPVRIKAAPDMTFGDLARQVQERLNNGMMNSHCAPNEICSAPGRTTPLFDHILNMHNFEMPKVDLFNDPEKYGIRLLSGYAYVSPSSDLCVLFNDEFNDNQMICHFNYNSYAYSRESISLLAENFSHVLETIAAQGPDVALDAIESIEPDLFTVSRQAVSYRNYKIASALRRSVLSAPYEALLRVAKRSQVHSYGYQQIVLRKDKPLEGLVLLIEGLINLSMENREGWNVPFRIVSAGEVVAMSGVSGRSPGYSGIVESGHASLVTIPKDALLELLCECPDIIPRLVDTLDRRLFEYVRQWIFAN